jgi:hypothetical protein
METITRTLVRFGETTRAYIMATLGNNDEIANTGVIRDSNVDANAFHMITNLERLTFTTLLNDKFGGICD